MSKLTMDKLVSLCKQYGFIFQGSEIYGGMANTWDYGPLGVELKNNLKKLWWQRFVQHRQNSYGLEASILMNPKVWEASGHLASFSDPLIDCKKCKNRFRPDNLISAKNDPKLKVDLLTDEELMAYIYKEKISCPHCGALDYTNIRHFNVMFKTHRGVTEDNKSIVYLRPETAQGQYINFLNVQRAMRAKIPFGIGQIGKVFRNEITPGNFTFRTIEFEQMEYQYFCNDKEADKAYQEFKEIAKDFIVSLGIDSKHLRYKDHDKLAHYAKAAVDLEYLFPFGWGEINGTHHRGDFDLTNHQQCSNKSQAYLDPYNHQSFIPNIVESSYGIDRIMLSLLCEAYDEELLVKGETREVMRFHPSLAPYKIAVLPLIKKLHQSKAEMLFELLNNSFMAFYDDSGSIGKRYRRQDVMGTPFCLTIDDETLTKETITIRDRDTMEQERIAINQLNSYLKDKLKIN